VTALKTVTTLKTVTPLIATPPSRPSPGMMGSGTWAAAGNLWGRDPADPTPAPDGSDDNR
jgi:hypothetical protein